MINIQQLMMYVKDQSSNEFKRFEHFIMTHTLKNMEWNGLSIPYYCSGTGNKTLLFLSGAHGIPASLYNSILNYEDEFQIIVADISQFHTLEEISFGINGLLEKEGIKRVVPFGQSFGAITAQIYFKRNTSKCDGMILINPVAPKKTRNKWLWLSLFHIIPISLLRALHKKKLKSLGSSSEFELSKEARERLEMVEALLSYVMDNELNKQKLTKTLKWIFEWNEKDTYNQWVLNDWQGKIFLITSEDDTGYKYIPLISESLPDVKLFTFPKGFKHIAPIVHMEKTINMVKEFLKSL